jgi:hypothetical protein
VVRPISAIVRAAIAVDPGKADEIRQRLADITAKADEAQRQADLQQRLADLEQMKLMFSTASAREQSADLVKAGSPIALGAPVISALVLMTFAAVVLVQLAGSGDPIFGWFRPRGACRFWSSETAWRGSN